MMDERILRAEACMENMHGLNPYWIGDLLKSVEVLLDRITGVVDESLLAELRGQLWNLYCGRIVRNDSPRSIHPERKSEKNELKNEK